MKTFLPKFAIKQYSMYVAMVVIFVHTYVLDEDLNCTCDGDRTTCSCYLVLPFLILCALQLWTDEPFKRVWKYTCPACECSCSCFCKCRCKFFLVLCFHIMKAVCIGLLWVLSVLIDGDWFVCCCNTYQEHPELGCKDKTNITAEERVLIAKLKNESMLLGLGALLVGFVVVSLVLPLGWKKCCEKGKCSSCCDRKLLYEEMILEEEDGVLTEIIRKAAKDKLTEEIQKKLENEEWGECFDVAEELIKSKTPPGQRGDIPLENQAPERGPLMEESVSPKRTTTI